MKFYYPEKTNQIDFVGYNNAIRLILKAMPDLFVDNPAEADYRFYSNIPIPPSKKDLLASGLPIFYYTMFETTLIPKVWIKFLNKYVSIVGVPSEFCRKVFIASGLKKPISVMSLGISIDEITDSSKISKSKEYNFMWQGMAMDGEGSHKGADSARNAFLELKKDGLLENATLVMKTRFTDSKLNSSIEIKDYTFQNGIRLIQTDLPRNELIDLYNSVDCCINTTRGEGFGLIPLEQMAMGKPVIVTGHSMLPYVHDYIKPKHQGRKDNAPFLPIDFKMERSPMFWNYRHIKISLSAISYNFSGVQKVIQLLPKFGEMIIPINHYVARKINNWLLWFQQKTGFFFNKGHKSITIYQEKIGYDAQIDMQDLKSKMLWCYNNREKAEAMGLHAREYALREWSLERMKLDFQNNILPLLERGLHGRSN
jgi:hypothetical protein